MYAKKEDTMAWIWNKKEPIEWKEACETLRRYGFTRYEINRLVKLRRALAIRDQKVREDRRLQFVHWLVQNGRLTDQIA